MSVEKPQTKDKLRVGHLYDAYKRAAAQEFLREAKPAGCGYRASQPLLPVDHLAHRRAAAAQVPALRQTEHRAGRAPAAAEAAAAAAQPQQMQAAGAAEPRLPAQPKALKRGLPRPAAWASGMDNAGSAATLQPSKVAAPSVPAVKRTVLSAPAPAVAPVSPVPQRLDLPAAGELPATAEPQLQQTSPELGQPVTSALRRAARLATVPKPPSQTRSIPSPQMQPAERARASRSDIVVTLAAAGAAARSAAPQEKSTAAATAATQQIDDIAARPSSRQSVASSKDSPGGRATSLEAQKYSHIPGLCTRKPKSEVRVTRFKFLRVCATTLIQLASSTCVVSDRDSAR